MLKEEWFWFSKSVSCVSGQCFGRFFSPGQAVRFGVSMLSSGGELDGLFDHNGEAPLLSLNCLDSVSRFVANCCYERWVPSTALQFISPVV